MSTSGFSVNLPGHAMSVVGNLADLAEGQVLLPQFAEQRADGLWLNPALVGEPQAAVQFVDRVFAAGSCFVGLDYAALCASLYPQRPSDAPRPEQAPAPVRLAAAIRAIPPERQALYKGVKLLGNGQAAEYVFEPVHIERVVETPVFADEPDENGDYPIIGSERSVIAEPASLDIDEFVAMMWQKGVRGGLDLAAVRDAMAAPGVQRIEIARRQEPVAGKDATLKEETEALHRDDSPRILPDGRIDLRQFKNRFPQIAADTRLMRKVPRQFGECGVDVAGKHLEPDPPRDFRLADMAGPGTEMQTTPDGDFIVAIRDGFLNLDTSTHLVSVTDKIINREGISLRTTGDLSLAGDHYEEMGEVQERRVIEGKHMTFHADVFGRIESSGGHVLMKSNLVGGKVLDTDGQVTIEGRASQAVIEARGGSVTVDFAENCIIVASRIEIRRALLCTIVADDIAIEDACACVIAGRRLALQRCSARKDAETLVMIVIPDFTSLDRNLAEQQKALAELQQRQQQKLEQADALAAQAELKRYLTIQGQVRTGKIKLTPVQEDQLRQMGQNLARPLQQLRGLRTEAQTLAEEIATEAAEIEALNQRRAEAAEGVECQITEVTGTTTAITSAQPPGSMLFPAASPGNIKMLLAEPQAARQSLFRAASGSFSWRYKN